MSMEIYLNKNIKEIINQFPNAADVLNEYDIACAPCNVGTCLLKDVVEVHNLSSEAEHELLKKIAQVIFPGKEVEIPKIKRKVAHAAGQIKYSPAIRKLVDEHVYIKKLLAAIPIMLESIDVSNAEDKQLILDSIDFIRSYADKYHHAKEDDILYPWLDKNLSVSQIGEMFSKFSEIDKQYLSASQKYEGFANMIEEK